MRAGCNICRDKFTSSCTVLVTLCGHLYHSNCINEWLKRSKSCPECRTRLRDPPHRVYLGIHDDPESRASYNEELEDEVVGLRTNLAELKAKYHEIEASRESAANEIREKDKIIEECFDTIQVLRLELRGTYDDARRLELVDQENQKLKKKLELLTSLDTLINGSENEARELIRKTPITPLAVHQLCIYMEALKYQLKLAKEKYKKEVKTVEYKCEAQIKKLKELKRPNSNKMNQTVRTAVNLRTLAEYPEKRFQKRVASPEDDAISEERERLEKLLMGECSEPKKRMKIVNNLEKKTKPVTSGYTSDDEIPSYTPFCPIRAMKSMAARENTSIFAKFMVPGEPGPSGAKMELHVTHGSSDDGRRIRPTLLYTSEDSGVFRTKKFKSTKGI